MRIYLFCYGETADKYSDYECLTPEGRRLTKEFREAHVKDVCFDRLFLMPQHGQYASETLGCLGLHFPDDAITIETPDVSSSEEYIRRIQRSPRPPSLVLALGSTDQQGGLIRSLFGSSVFLRKCEGVILEYGGSNFTFIRKLCL